MAKLILNMPDVRDPSIPIMVIDNVEDFKEHKNGTISFKLNDRRWSITDIGYAVETDG